MDKAYKELTLEQLEEAKEIYEDCFRETGNKEILKDVERVNAQIMIRELKGEG